MGREVKAVKHISIIMDGNGRWASSQGLPRTRGHRQGAEVVIDIVKGAKELGIKYLTLFVFSSENWGRPAEEIESLLELMRQYISQHFNNLIEEDVRLKVIGDITRLPPDLQEKIIEAEEQSADKSGLVVNLAINYGGRLDIVNSCKRIASKVLVGDLEIADIDEKEFGLNLYTSDIPDPDIVIRTGGENRISNFLLWQMAYSELFFIDKYWPDFTRFDLEEVLQQYENRNRRYGKV